MTNLLTKKSLYEANTLNAQKECRGGIVLIFF